MQPLILTMKFWDPNHFDFTDALNQEIWNRSPEVQQQIQPMAELTQPGLVGAQQAMLDENLLAERDTPLPWVPDSVRKGSQTKDGVTVVGLAYAGFIQEYSSRRSAMSLNNYLRASSVEDFQRLFLRDVVQKDASYYLPIEHLCSSIVSSSRLSLVDLCRASFVRRGVAGRNRSDCSSSANIKHNLLKYERYVENEQAMEWLWRRFANSPAKCVLALGLNAEHGLLQMFDKHKMKITQSEALFIPKKFASGGWARPYADPKKTLGYWLKSSTWWVVQGTVNNANRTWYVLPVYHPSRYNSSKYDPGYQKAIKVLEQMQSSISS